MTSTPRQRLQWLDAARGLAALSVTSYHFQFGGGLAHLTHWPWLTTLDWPGSRLAVPLFFVISGFSIHYAEREKIRDWASRPAVLRGYLLRRWWRIYPPYVAALILAIGLGRALGKPIHPLDVAAHLLMVHQFIPAYFNSINVVFWSVGVEMWLYVLYPLALRWRESHGLPAAGVLIFLVSAASIVLTAAVSPTANVVGLWFVLNVFFGWCLGAAIADGFGGDHPFFFSRRWLLSGVALFALHAGVFAAGAFEGRLWPAFVPSIVVLSAWLLAIIVLLERRRIASGGGQGWLLKTLCPFGTISYSLYLVHEPLINAREAALGHLPNHLVSRAAFFLWYAVPVVLAWLCWRWVEKPSMKISKRLKASTP